MLSFSFLICNYNGGKLLKKAIYSVLRQSYKNYEIIVIDNGSKDDSHDLKYFNRRNCKLIRLETNVGFATANNIGFENSNGEYIVLMNNDVVLSKHWLASIKNHIQSTDADSVATLILQKNSPGKIDSAGFDFVQCGTVFCWKSFPKNYFYESSHSPMGPVAACAVYKRSAIKDSGLFSDEYFAYYEDTDLAMRLFLLGYRCSFCNDAVSWHEGSATGKGYSDFHRFYLRRNVEFVYWTNFIGNIAFKNIIYHFIYEFLTLFTMAKDRQLLTFLKAKISFIRYLPNILYKRKALVRKLRKQNQYRPAIARLNKKLLKINSLIDLKDKKDRLAL
jgi:GT2 family glycosyltransferase